MATPVAPPLLALLVLLLTPVARVTLADDAPSEPTAPAEDDHGEPKALVMTVNPKKMSALVGDRFLSITLDPTYLIEKKMQGPGSVRTLALARGLAPSYLRLAGPSSDFLHFTRDHGPSTNGSISDTDLQKLASWAQDAGMDLVLCLNALVRADEVWDSRNFLDLLAFTDRLGYNLAWQLGYESGGLERAGVSGLQLGADLARARTLLSEFPRYQGARLLGPDLSAPLSGRTSKEAAHYLQDVSKSAAPAPDAVVWQPWSPAVAEGRDPVVDPDLVRDDVNRLLGRAAARRSLWIAESGGESTSRFEDAITWAQRIQVATRVGADVILRQPDLSADSHQPSPDYWVSFLHRRLCGRAVLDSRLSGNRSVVSVVSYCTPAPTGRRVAPRFLGGFTKLGYERGALTIMAVNKGSTTAKVILKFGASTIPQTIVHQYILTAPAGDMNSQSTLLNEEPLVLGNGGGLPSLSPTVMKVGRAPQVTLPPHSVAFFVVPGANARACLSAPKSAQEAAEAQIRLRPPTGEEVEISFDLEGFPAPSPTAAPSVQVLPKMSERPLPSPPLAHPPSHAVPHAPHEDLQHDIQTFKSKIKEKLAKMEKPKRIMPKVAEQALASGEDHLVGKRMKLKMRDSHLRLGHPRHHDKTTTSTESSLEDEALPPLDSNRLDEPMEDEQHARRKRALPDRLFPMEDLNERFSLRKKKKAEEMTIIPVTGALTPDKTEWLNKMSKRPTHRLHTLAHTKKLAAPAGKDKLPELKLPEKEVVATMFNPRKIAHIQSSAELESENRGKEVVDDFPTGAVFIKAGAESSYEDEEHKKSGSFDYIQDDDDEEAAKKKEGQKKQQATEDEKPEDLIAQLKDADKEKFYFAPGEFYDTLKKVANVVSEKPQRFDEFGEIEVIKAPSATPQPEAGDETIVVVTQAAPTAEQERVAKAKSQCEVQRFYANAEEVVKQEDSMEDIDTEILLKLGKKYLKEHKLGLRGKPRKQWKRDDTQSAYAPKPAEPEDRHMFGPPNARDYYSGDWLNGGMMRMRSKRSTADIKPNVKIVGAKNAEKGGLLARVRENRENRPVSSRLSLGLTTTAAPVVKKQEDAVSSKEKSPGKEEEKKIEKKQESDGKSSDIKKEATDEKDEIVSAKKSAVPAKSEAANAKTESASEKKETVAKEKSAAEGKKEIGDEKNEEKEKTLPRRKAREGRRMRRRRRQKDSLLGATGIPRKSIKPTEKEETTGKRSKRSVSAFDSPSAHFRPMFESFGTPEANLLGELESELEADDAMLKSLSKCGIGNERYRYGQIPKEHQEQDHYQVVQEHEETVNGHHQRVSESTSGYGTAEYGPEGLVVKNTPQYQEVVVQEDQPTVNAVQQPTGFEEDNLLKHYITGSNVINDAPSVLSELADSQGMHVVMGSDKGPHSVWDGNHLTTTVHKKKMKKSKKTKNQHSDVVIQAWDNGNVGQDQIQFSEEPDMAWTDNGASASEFASQSIPVTTYSQKDGGDMVEEAPVIVWSDGSSPSTPKRKASKRIPIFSNDQSVLVRDMEDSPVMVGSGSSESVIQDVEVQPMPTISQDDNGYDIEEAPVIIWSDSVPKKKVKHAKPTSSLPVHIYNQNNGPSDVESPSPVVWVDNLPHKNNHFEDSRTLPVYVEQNDGGNYIEESPAIAWIENTVPVTAERTKPSKKHHRAPVVQSAPPKNPFEDVDALLKFLQEDAVSSFQQPDLIREEFSAPVINQQSGHRNGQAPYQGYSFVNKVEQSSPSLPPRSHKPKHHQKPVQAAPAHSGVIFSSLDTPNAQFDVSPASQVYVTDFVAPPALQQIPNAQSEDFHIVQQPQNVIDFGNSFVNQHHHHRENYIHTPVVQEEVASLALQPIPNAQSEDFEIVEQPQNVIDFGNRFVNQHHHHRENYINTPVVQEEVTPLALQPIPSAQTQYTEIVQQPQSPIDFGYHFINQQPPPAKPVPNHHHQNYIRTSTVQEQIAPPAPQQIPSAQSQYIEVVEQPQDSIDFGYQFVNQQPPPAKPEPHHLQQNYIQIPTVQEEIAPPALQQTPNDQPQYIEIVQQPRNPIDFGYQFVNQQPPVTKPAPNHHHHHNFVHTRPVQEQIISQPQYQFVQNSLPATEEFAYQYATAVKPPKNPASSHWYQQFPSQAPTVQPGIVQAPEVQFQQNTFPVSGDNRYLFAPDENAPKTPTPSHSFHHVSAQAPSHPMDEITWRTLQSTLPVSGSYGYQFGAVQHPPKKEPGSIGRHQQAPGTQQIEVEYTQQPQKSAGGNHEFEFIPQQVPGEKPGRGRYGYEFTPIFTAPKEHRHGNGHRRHSSSSRTTAREAPDIQWVQNSLPEPGAGHSLRFSPVEDPKTSYGTKHTKHRVNVQPAEFEIVEQSKDYPPEHGYQFTSVQSPAKSTQHFNVEASVPRHTEFEIAQQSENIPEEYGYQFAPVQLPADKLVPEISQQFVNVQAPAHSTNFEVVQQSGNNPADVGFQIASFQPPAWKHVSQSTPHFVNVKAPVPQPGEFEIVQQSQDIPSGYGYHFASAQPAKKKHFSKNIQFIEEPLTKRLELIEQPQNIEAVSEYQFTSDQVPVKNHPHRLVQIPQPDQVQFVQNAVPEEQYKFAAAPSKKHFASLEPQVNEPSTVEVVQESQNRFQGLSVPTQQRADVGGDNDYDYVVVGESNPQLTAEENQAIQLSSIHATQAQDPDVQPIPVGGPSSIVDIETANYDVAPQWQPTTVHETGHIRRRGKRSIGRRTQQDAHSKVMLETNQLVQEEPTPEPSETVRANLTAEEIKALQDSFGAEDAGDKASGEVGSSVEVLKDKDMKVKKAIDIIQEVDTSQAIDNIEDILGTLLQMTDALKEVENLTLSANGTEAGNATASLLDFWPWNLFPSNSSGLNQSEGDAPMLIESANLDWLQDSGRKEAHVKKQLDPNDDIDDAAWSAETEWMRRKKEARLRQKDLDAQGHNGIVSGIVSSMLGKVASVIGYLTSLGNKQ